MISNLWINLPVKDLENSLNFFKEIGFGPTSKPPHSKNSYNLKVGNTDIMFFKEPKFKEFVHTALADTDHGSEMLLSVEVGSREEVDKIFNNAERAGGMAFEKPQKRNGRIYEAGFKDPDGHRWNIIYLDRK